MARGVAPEFIGGAAVAVLQSWFCAVACGAALHAAAVLRRGQRSCSAELAALKDCMYQSSVPCPTALEDN